MDFLTALGKTEPFRTEGGRAAGLGYTNLEWTDSWFNDAESFSSAAGLGSLLPADSAQP